MEKILHFIWVFVAMCVAPGCQAERAETPMAEVGPGAAAPDAVEFTVVNEGPGPVFLKQATGALHRIRDVEHDEVLDIDRGCTPCACSDCDAQGGCNVCSDVWGRIIVLEPGQPRRFRWNNYYWALGTADRCGQPCLRRMQVDPGEYAFELSYGFALAPSQIFGEIDLSGRNTAVARFEAYSGDQLDLSVTNPEPTPVDALFELSSPPDPWSSMYAYAARYSDEFVGLVAIGERGRAVVIVLEDSFELGTSEIVAASIQPRIDADPEPSAWFGTVTIDEVTPRHISGTFDLTHDSAPTQSGSFTAIRSDA